MTNLLSCFLQVLLLTCVIPIAFGLAVYICRGIFISLVDPHSGRQLLVGCLAPSTPLRELGHAVAAVLFMHRITECSFLNPHDPDGELGFVEHSYNPRNPVAVLGNLFYALAPLAVGLFAVYAVLLLCFGSVMTDFSAELADIAQRDGGFLAYMRAAAMLLPAMLRADTGVFLKIVGFVLLLFLCMGVFVSTGEVLEALGGFCIYAALAFAFCGALMLFDTRVQNLVLGGLRRFCVTVTALFMAVLVAVAVWVALAAFYFVLRTLFSTPEQSTALQPYDPQ